MSMRKGLLVMATCLALVACGKDKDWGSKTALQGPGLGQPLSPAEIALIDIDINPDGSNLPAGKGTIAEGEKVFSQHCQVCHGPAGEAAVGTAPQLTGGVRSLSTPKPIKSVSSLWPYAPMVFDYIRRAMPPTKPRSLTNDQVNAVTAYLLSVDGIVSGDIVLDAKTLAKVQMPNRGGFIPVDHSGKKGKD